MASKAEAYADILKMFEKSVFYSRRRVERGEIKLEASRAFLAGRVQALTALQKMIQDDSDSERR